MDAQESQVEVGGRPTLTLGWRGKTTRVPDIRYVEVIDELAALIEPARPVARVLAVGPFVEVAPLDICLGHWCDWMRKDDRDLGVKGQVGLRSDGNDDDREGYDDSAALADAAAARSSREIAMATDAMINSLDRHHKAAIYRRCNITSVWRFPLMDFVVTLPLAEEALIEKLSKNVATRAFW